MAEINISGYTVLVDDEDVEKIQQYNWWVDNSLLRRHNRYYFRTKIKHGLRKYETIKLHRFIMGCSYIDGTVIDHINNNTLDNRKCNMRFCTQKENARNKRRETRNTSGYKGAKLDKCTGRYKATIKYEQKNYALGSFIDLTDAATAYDDVARFLFGEFALVNFPDRVYDEARAKTIYMEATAPVMRTNSSGYEGVTWDSASGKWKARYILKGRTKWLGTFINPEDGHKVRCAYIEKLKQEGVI